MMNKKTLVITITITTILFSFSIKKEKKFIPPGTAQITETFFADETEVSNFSWQEYETWAKNKYGKNSKEHLATLPDTTVWLEETAYNAPFVQHYYRHVAYKDYPVVGISYEQVIDFCKWRTERVKEFYYIKNKKELTIEYRLPSKEEWELMGNNGAGLFNNNGKNKNGMVTFNHARPTEDATKKSIDYDNQDVTTPVYSYWKNFFGLYNLFGNVAEMIAEKGVCKGGGWHNTLEECHPGKDIKYIQPTPWLGFRCVCVLTK